MRIRTVQNDVALLVSNPRLLGVLEAAGIRTTEDVLFTPLADLLLRLSTADIKTTDIIMLQDEIAAVCAAQGLRGDELLAQETETISAMKPIMEGVLGVKELDELLGETLSGPHVVELTGPARSGKSAIATQLATRCLSQIQDSSVLWIDCAGDFSGHRARQACETLGMEEDAIGATLERLQVVFCFEMHEFQSALDNIEASLSENPDASLRYIIIDPITPLLSAQLTGSSSQGHATMTSIMQQLARIAHEHKLTVLVINRTATSTNQPTLSAFPNTTTKPALGPTFTFLAHATISLGIADAAFGGVAVRGQAERRTHVAEVLRSRVGPSQCWCAFDILNGVALPYEPPS